MKYLSVFVFLILFSACQRDTFFFEVTNNTDIDRIEEPVFIEFDKLPKNIELGNYSILSGDKYIPYQLVDKNGDGKKDNLFLLVDIKSNETLKFEFKDKIENQNIGNRTNIRFGEKMQPYNEIKSFKRLIKSDTVKASDLFLMEGPAWENDNIAFRNYYDQRNGMDIFGKRIKEMVLDSVGIEGTNYHQLSNWGMDVLKVGNSLGAGAIGIQIGDTIYPVRDLKNSTYTLIEDGPLYASLKLTHNDFNVRGREYDIDHLISICAGTQYYNSQISIQGLQGDEKLVTGIVNLHSDTLYSNTIGDIYIFNTFDKQAEDGANMGLALLINKDVFTENLTLKSTIGIDNTYMFGLKLDKDKPVEYRFYVGWETANSNFSNNKNFTDYLINEADIEAKPLIISFKK